MTRLTRLAFLLLLITAAPAVALAQAGGAPLPVPTTPVAFCVNQAAPPATSHQLVFDGQAPEAVTMVTPTTADSATATPIKAFCTANAPGWTHGFTIAAARFTVGSHAVRVVSINQFGSTSGTNYPINVGLTPGAATIVGAGQLP